MAMALVVDRAAWVAANLAVTTAVRAGEKALVRAEVKARVAARARALAVRRDKAKATVLALVANPLVTALGVPATQAAAPTCQEVPVAAVEAKEVAPAVAAAAATAAHPASRALPAAPASQEVRVAAVKAVGVDPAVVGAVTVLQVSPASMVTPPPEQGAVSRVPATGFQALVVMVNHPQGRLPGRVKALPANRLPDRALRAAAHPRVVAAQRHLARAWALVVKTAAHPAAVVAAMVVKTRGNALS